MKRKILIAVSLMLGLSASGWALFADDFDDEIQSLEQDVDNSVGNGEAPPAEADTGGEASSGAEMTPPPAEEAPPESAPVANKPEEHHAMPDSATSTPASPKPKVKDRTREMPKKHLAEKKAEKKSKKASKKTAKAEKADKKAKNSKATKAAKTAKNAKKGKKKAGKG